jgi:nitrogen fixation/metabolism regulation signal transduction histidine kinase
VTQRGRFILYLAVLHGIFAALGAALLYQSIFWLIPLEVAFALSLLAAVVITRRLFRDAGFARAGLQMLKEHDFASRFREVGHEEIDELIRLYNRMMDGMREERTRLQEQHHFLSHVLRVSPSGILILDFDHRITTTNAAAERLLALDAASMIGRRLNELPPPAGPLLSAIGPRSSGSLDDASRQLRCHHGTFIDRGFPRSFILIEELTSEIRKAERRAYEKLIRVMAHEVNNSVTGANSLLHSSLNYSRELAETSRADFEQALGVVIGRTDQLNQFMRRFADVFRLPAPLKRPERVLTLLEHNVRLLAARPDAAGVTWAWDVGDPGMTVPLDRGQMEQAFLNVLQNAVDAIGGNGTISIRVGRVLSDPPRGPAVIIEDTGPGITPEAQANLFTPFFSTKPHGQGVGLTLVREILTAHGFDHALERRPGGPTQFTISFSANR